MIQPRLTFCMQRCSSKMAPTGKNYVMLLWLMGANNICCNPSSPETQYLRVIDSQQQAECFIVNAAIGMHCKPMMYIHV